MADDDNNSSSSGSSETEDLSSLSKSTSASKTEVVSEPMPDPSLQRHLDLLKRGDEEKDSQQLNGTPFFTQKVLASNRQTFTRYGFLAGNAMTLNKFSGSEEKKKELLKPENDPRLYVNVAAPLSTFICGSQGSGKSHTLSCLLKNYLLKSDASELENPLTAMVFHYDTFSSDEGGIPCKAAYLGSEGKMKVKVYCAPTNLETIKVHV